MTRDAQTAAAKAESTAATADESQTDVTASEARIGFVQRFTILKTAAPELWATFGIKFFAILSYYLMNKTVVLWLQSDMGYGDIKAGSIISTWSAIMTLVTVFVGSFTDAIGIRRTFLVGMGICVAARVAMTTSVGALPALALGLFPVAVGEAMLGPVMVAATKRYATTAQRSISFSIIYAIMNVAFLVGGNIFDLLRRGLGEHGHYTLPMLGVTLSTYRVLLLLSLIFMIPNLLLVYFFIRPGVEVTDEGVVITPEEKKYVGHGFVTRMGLTVKDAAKDSAILFAGLWKQAGFIRFLIFLFFATFMRMIFYHTNYTLTPMGIRELGDGAPVGRLDTINNWLIIFLVPVVGALTQKVSAYRMVVFGCCLGASSVFIMALPVHIYQPLADGWLGHVVGDVFLGLKGPVNPWYISITLFYVAISFGEAFYSPRLYEYAAVMAPRGQEASYMALSYLPFFVAKLTVGVLSGFLLSVFCPKDGPRHSEMLWVVIGATTLIAPIGLIALRKYIQVHEEGRTD